MEQTIGADMERDLSRLAYRVKGQPMFETLAKVKNMKDVIHFELGDPDFQTPQNIIDAAVLSLYQGETHYVNSTGMDDMKEAVQWTTHKTRGFTPSFEQILVTPGANIIIYLVMSCLLNRGDEVIVPNPGFPTYFSVAEMLGIKVASVQLHERDGFVMTPANIRRRITNKTRLIIINSPSNPCGSVMEQEQIEEIYHIAHKHNLYIMSDEVYSRMLYGMKFYSPSMKDGCRKHTIVLNGFSKAFAMTGWRLGVALGPEKLIEKMGLLVQTLCSCVPAFTQRAGIAAITGSQEKVNEMMEIYRCRREYIINGLNEIEGIRCPQTDGGFYVFPNIVGTGMNSREFSDFALKNGVALLPGTDFGKFGEGYIRMTYALKYEQIKKGLDRLYESLRLYHKSSL